MAARSCEQGSSALHTLLVLFALCLCFFYLCKCVCLVLLCTCFDVLSNALLASHLILAWMLLSNVFLQLPPLSHLNN